MRSFLLIAFIILSVFSVLYFSWIESPRFSLHILVPDWLAKWADKHENDNIRTAVPLFFLGVITGLFLELKNVKVKWWFLSWALFVMLVFVAELGQLVLPLRSFDWKDITWGCVGSGLGIIIVYFINLVCNKN